jgi:protein TonB
MSYEKKNRKFISKPVYSGGEKALLAFVKSQVKYPKVEVADRKKGYVEVRVDINSKGKVIGAKIAKSLGKRYDQEALRVTKLLRWEVPGSGGRGSKVIFHRSVRVPFNPPAVVKQKKKNTMTYRITPTAAPSTSAPKPKQEGGGSYTYTINIG